MTPARNGLRSHAVVRSRSSQAKGELGLGRARRMDVVQCDRVRAATAGLCSRGDAQRSSTAPASRCLLIAG